MNINKWIECARFAHKVEFRNMARGGRWHLCRGTMAGGAMILPDSDSHDAEIIVSDVHTMSSDHMVACAIEKLYKEVTTGASK